MKIKTTKNPWKWKAFPRDLFFFFKSENIIQQVLQVLRISQEPLPYFFQRVPLRDQG
jgi:hypothetical protein